ncbi:MAG TPA: ATP-binding protein [Parafilimonas sp.]|nr:ATP-binding protein [Parafilimonas sp.]
MIKKIVVIGPESTGKSTLCEQLAQHFKTIWCKEYAREYLHINGVKYDYNDLLKIAQGQLAEEDDCIVELNNQYSISNIQYSKNDSPLTTHHSPLTARSSQLLFIDTNMYVMKVWYEYVFGKCEHLVLDEIAKRKYDLYLLCNIDLPWTADEMREYPDEQPRVELYHIYKDLLINQTTPWVEISGNYEERLQTAIGAVEKYCFV